nr:unnamed protein product [Callosobruchus chinensis]
MFTNLTTALRIMLSLPVSIASGERSFSSLKCKLSAHKLV